MTRLRQARKREKNVVDAVQEPSKTEDARQSGRHNQLMATPGASRLIDTRARPIRLIDLERRARFLSFVANGV